MHQCAGVKLFLGVASIIAVPMGLGIRTSDQPFIRDGNVCKGTQISCFICIVVHQSRCVKHFLGYRIVYQAGIERQGLVYTSFGPVSSVIICVLHICMFDFVLSTCIPLKAVLRYYPIPFATRWVEQLRLCPRNGAKAHGEIGRICSEGGADVGPCYPAYTELRLMAEIRLTSWGW